MQMHGGNCAHPVAPGKVRGQLGKSGLSPSTMWVPDQIIWLGSKSFYLLSHLPGPRTMAFFSWIFQFLSICAFTVWCDMIVLSNLYSWIAFFCTSECVLCRVYLCFSWLTLIEIHFQMYEQICLLFQINSHSPVTRRVDVMTSLKTVFNLSTQLWLSSL